MAEQFTYANLEYLENMSMGSNEMVAEMIDLFIDQIPEFTEGLDALFAQGDFHGLGALAHKAKSSVAVMGMNGLADDLKNLELSAKAGENQSTYPVLIERFKEQVQVTARELADYAAKIR